MKFLLLSACILAAANAHGHVGPIAMANLGISGATGSVKVYNGMIEVLLDLNGFTFPASPDMAACNASGLTYHIHFAKSGLPAAGGTGATCGAGNTGGHYDPWYACGGATNEGACQNKGGCINQTNGAYACSSANFGMNPFACEVGDWSGKYGKLWPVGGMGSSNMTYYFKSSAPNRFEVSAANLYNPAVPKSVVFHCGSPRLLCARFVPNVMMNTSMYYPGKGIAAARAANPSEVYSTDLGTVGGPYVEFGGGQMFIGGPLKMGGIAATCASRGLISMAVMQPAAAGTVPLTVAGTDAACIAAVGVAGGVYDPTFGCVPGSAAGIPQANGMPACQSQALALANDLTSTRCPNTAVNQTFNYTATTFSFLNPTADPYSNSQGALQPYLSMNPMADLTVDYRLMRQDSSLVNKVFFITCGSGGNLKTYCGKIIAGPVAPCCTPTTTTTPPNTTTTATAPATTAGSDRVVPFVGLVVALVGMVLA